MIRIVAFAVALLPLLLGPPVRAAEGFTPTQRDEIVRIVRDALRSDPSILREAVEALQADDTRQQQAASKAAIAGARDTLVTGADPVAGNLNGDVTVVEFFDARCPYCRRLEPTMTDLLGHDRAVRLVYKDLPILGPQSLLASKALLAAQRQGKYEALRTALMQNGAPEITAESIEAQAIRLGLDWPRLKRDMEDPAIRQQLDTNLALAHKLGIEGTPALIIGGTLIPGATTLADLQKAVNDARASKG
ncbi:MAG: thioredoxin domain-containing protein [Acetobacteraceae bacterium]|nr:thioredoxin domain-containing protein [Acetobacteraceae bacterium]